MSHEFIVDSSNFGMKNDLLKIIEELASKLKSSDFEKFAWSLEIVGITKKGSK